MSRPTIFKHKWWRFWRRSYWGLNPWRWDIPDFTKDAFEVDGFYSPSDGLGGRFGISKPMAVENEGVILQENTTWNATRVKPDTSVKWFGGEE